MIKENLKYTGFRWLINHRTPVRLSSTMYIQNRRDSSKFNGCSPLQNCNGLIGLKSAIAYFAYTQR